jgi:hypothetical protein
MCGEGAPCASALGVSLFCDALRLQLVGTQASWRRLGHAPPFGHSPDAGGVGASSGLGCALPFDYVDGAVPWLGLG